MIDLKSEQRSKVLSLSIKLFSERFQLNHNFVINQLSGFVELSQNISKKANDLDATKDSLVLLNPIECFEKSVQGWMNSFSYITLPQDYLSTCKMNVDVTYFMIGQDLDKVFYAVMQMRESGYKSYSLDL